MSGEGPRKKCSRDGEYGDDERICRRANVDETCIRALSESTRQRQARLLGDATVRVELGLQDDALAAATFIETAEAGANANNTVGTILDNFHAKMGRPPSLEEFNDIRVQNDERPIALGTLRNAISKWNVKDTLASTTLEALTQEFYAETNSLPTLALE